MYTTFYKAVQRNCGHLSSNLIPKCLVVCIFTMYRSVLACAVFAVLLVPNYGFFHHHKKVEVVATTPAIVYGLPVNDAPKNEGPLLTKEDYKAILGALKEKAKEANPLTWISSHIHNKFQHKRIPEYQLQPQLGFAQYNKIQYVPLVPVIIQPSPVAPLVHENQEANHETSEAHHETPEVHHETYTSSPYATSP
ncbi:uncharacterized protein LOC143916100 isoform X2 [Arctopsyche grandis]|uniref:uncharacterized protein LOC143916100 isoform X2 n=1 Tax=Arctopsyche grandis TaxID=121162 RepID=UPI00406D9F38